MSGKDYYQILGVPRTSTADEIKKAYRKLAVKYHPDRNPGNKNAEEKFKEATEAYHVLGDEKRRQNYDRFGRADVNFDGFSPGQNPFEGFDPFTGAGAGAAGSGAKWSRGGGPQGADFFGDIFSDLFGGGGFQQKRPGAGGPAKGTDLRYKLLISLEDAAQGTTKLISFVRRKAGKEDMARLSVTVPAGVKDGQRLKLKGEGDSPSGQGVPGDLYVIVNYQNHSLFERDNDDVRMSLPISFVDALLGSEVEIPTLRGAAQLKVPAGASSGQVNSLSL